jgi:DNA-binding NarL/FixJ family response regulator
MMERHDDLSVKTALERTVLIIDDHRSFAEALAIAIDAQLDLRCVAIADTAADGVDAAIRCRPDVVLVDMRLPDASGPSLVVQLLTMQPNLPVLALTAYADAASVAAAAHAGVCAFLRKECSIQDILATLRMAGDGPMTIDAGTLGAMMQAPRRVETVDVDGMRLTPREQEVLDLLAQAYDAQGIARRLGISVHTTRGYVKALLSKLNAHSQLEAVVHARQRGLIVDPVLSAMPRHAVTTAGHGSHSPA